MQLSTMFFLWRLLPQHISFDLLCFSNARLTRLVPMLPNSQIQNTLHLLLIEIRYTKVCPTHRLLFTTLICVTIDSRITLHQVAQYLRQTHGLHPGCEWDLRLIQPILHQVTGCYLFCGDDTLWDVHVKIFNLLETRTCCIWILAGVLTMSGDYSIRICSRYQYLLSHSGHIRRNALNN